MQFGNTIGKMRKTESYKRMVESVILLPGELFHLIYRKPAEIAHFMTEINIMLFITCFLRRMCGEHQALLYLFQLTVVFAVQVKSCRQSVRFIKMIQFRVKANNVNQL